MKQIFVMMAAIVSLFGCKTVYEDGFSLFNTKRIKLKKVDTTQFIRYDTYEAELYFSKKEVLEESGGKIKKC